MASKVRRMPGSRTRETRGGEGVIGRNEVCEQWRWRFKRSGVEESVSTGVGRGWWGWRGVLGLFDLVQFRRIVSSGFFPLGATRRGTGRAPSFRPINSSFSRQNNLTTFLASEISKRRLFCVVGSFRKFPPKNFHDFSSVHA